MKIILPPHNKIASPVKSYWSIRKEVKELSKLAGSTFTGKWKDAASLAHSQVSDEPMNFFVVNPRMKGYVTQIPFVVLNPKIIAYLGEKKKNKEACMSFPNNPIMKMKRHTRLAVSFEVPFLLFFKRKVQKEIDGFEAMIFQHETDHANGKNIYEHNNYKK